MLKRLNDEYSGYGGEERNGKKYGFEGYTEDRAQSIANDLIISHQTKGHYLNIDVKVVPMDNGNFKVVDRSTYESAYY